MPKQPTSELRKSEVSVTQNTSFNSIDATLIDSLPTEEANPPQVVKDLDLAEQTPDPKVVTILNHMSKLTVVEQRQLIESIGKTPNKTIRRVLTALAGEVSSQPENKTKYTDLQLLVAAQDALDNLCKRYIELLSNAPALHKNLNQLMEEAFRIFPPLSPTFIKFPCGIFASKIALRKVLKKVGRKKARSAKLEISPHPTLDHRWILDSIKTSRSTGHDEVFLSDWYFIYESVDLYSIRCSRLPGKIRTPLPERYYETLKPKPKLASAKITKNKSEQTPDKNKKFRTKIGKAPQ